MKTRLFIGMLLLTACPAVEPTGEESAGDSVPAPVQATFTMYCALPACHSGVQEPNLSEGNTAESIKGVGTTGIPFVTFGDVENSRLAEILLPSTPGNMPPIGNPKPPPLEVAVIFGWIAGAPFPEDETTSGTSTTMPTTTMTESSGGEPMLCSLEVIDPAADVGAAVDAGNTATQIPTVIGDVLVANCGCHYTDTVPMEYGAVYAGNQGLATLDDFQGDWMGILPGGFEGMPAYAAIAARIDFVAPMPPPLYCDPDGEPAMESMTMTQADYDLLTHWLGMEAPDGASYVPP
jgi:hypothetical protein